MARIETWFNQDLKQAVKVRYIDGNVFSADNGGNVVGVNVFDEGQPATLSGTVSGSVIRADGVTVAIIGTLSGNKASVILPQSAYVVPGALSVVIKLTSGSVITTLCAVVANVYVSSTDSIVDPGTIIPSVETLIAEIEAAIATIPADYSTLWASLAPVYSASKSYAIGDYATYDGHLYRCVYSIPSPESWNVSHWVQVSVCNDFSDINNVLVNDTTNIFNSDYVWSGSQHGLVIDAGQFSGIIRVSGTKTNSNITHLTQHKTVQPGKYTLFFKFDEGDTIPGYFGVALYSNNNVLFQFTKQTDNYVYSGFFDIASASDIYIYTYDPSGTANNYSAYVWFGLTSDYDKGAYFGKLEKESCFNMFHGAYSIIENDKNNMVSPGVFLAYDNGIAVSVDPDTWIATITGLPSGTIFLTNKITLPAGDYTYKFDIDGFIPYSFGVATSRTSVVKQTRGVSGVTTYREDFTLSSATDVYIFSYFGASSSITTTFRIWLGNSNNVGSAFYGKEIKKEVTKRLWGSNSLISDTFGKKINVLGDSLTYGSGADFSYTKIIADELNGVVRNYGIHGSTVSNSSHDPMSVRYADMDNDADIVCCMGGTNDYWQNLPLGVMGDTTNTTFYGALDVLIKGLVTKYPTGFVYMVTPIHGYIQNDYTEEPKSNIGSMKDVVNAIKEVSAKYSVPVLDLFNNAGLYPRISQQRSIYYTDGVHLTNAGQTKLGKMHVAFILSHFPR